MSVSLVPSFFLTILANGSLSLSDAAQVYWLEQSDPYFHDSPTALYAFVVLSLVALVIVLPALVWHIRAHNLPAASIVAWTAWLNASDLANALIWPTDDLVSAYHGEGYCDIAIKISLAADVGLVCAALCILRSLAGALDVSKLTVYTPPSEKRRKLFFESSLCFGLPLIHSLSHLFVQDARYMIYAGAGCAPTWQSSAVSVVVIGVPPVILALTAAVYAVLVLVRLTKYRRDFAEVLSASSAGVSVSRFFRLYSLSALLVALYLPLKAHDLYLDATSTTLQSFDWAAAHAPSAWGEIRLYPMFGAVLPFLWSYVALAAAVIVTVGLGSDAHAFYRDVLLVLGFGSIFPSVARSQRGSRHYSDSSPSSTTLESRLGEARHGRSNVLAGTRNSTSDRSSAATSVIKKHKWWAILAEPAGAHLGFSSGNRSAQWTRTTARPGAEAPVIANTASVTAPSYPPPMYDAMHAAHDSQHSRTLSAEEITWRAMEARFGIR